MNDKNYLVYFLNSIKDVDFATKELNRIKPYISSKTVEETFYDVEEFKLSGKASYNGVQTVVLDNAKNNLNKKIIKNIRLFENFEINYNRVFIIGSLDYLKIVLKEEKLNRYMKNDLFNMISEYVMDIEKIYSICNENNDIFENMNLSTLEDFFNRLQDYISQDLNVLPRLDDDNFDETLLFN